MNYFQYYQDIVDRAKEGTLSVEEYDKVCSRADWFYYFSDMNLSGFHMECLRNAAEFNDDFKRIYNRESAKRFNNENFYPADDTSRKYEYPYPEVGV